jgi:hypothetical protein
MMLRRWIVCIILFILPLWAHADWAADRDASAGYVTVTTLATAIDEAVPFCVVYLSDLPADFHTAMSDASDTDGKTIRVSTSDGTTQLACVPIGVSTSTDTGCLIFLGTGMSASVDVDYRVYVGNASLTMPAASAAEQLVFANYAGVYFPGVDTRDWTSGGRTLTAVNSPGTAASGLEGITAATYNGSSSYHKYEGTPAVTNAPLTFESLGIANNTTHNGTAFGVGTSSSGNNFSLLYFRGATGLGDRISYLYRGNSATPSAGESSTSFSSSTLTYLAGSRNGGTTGTSTAYKDGGNSGTDSTTTAAITGLNRTSIGALFSGSASSYLNGNIAVALLSSSVRSADYVATMQDNWAGALYSAGAWTALDSCTDGSTGWVLFQTAATTSASGTLVDWTSTSNALVDDSSYTQAALDGGGDTDSETLKLTNPDYGTTIPTGAASYTVQFRIKRVRGTGGSNEVNDLVIKLIDDTGALVGDNLAAITTDWPNTAATADYTVTGVTLDGTEFTSAAGLAISATAFNAAGAVDARVLVGWMKVDWTCPGSGPFPLLLISEE